MKCKACGKLIRTQWREGVNRDSWWELIDKNPEGIHMVYYYHKKCLLRPRVGEVERYYGL